MWNEPSLSVAKKTQESHGIKDPVPAEVESVEPGSIGEELGFQPGDKLISINGIQPRDLIDYRLLIVEEELELRVLDEAGKIHQINTISRDFPYPSYNYLKISSGIFSDCAVHDIDFINWILELRKREYYQKPSTIRREKRNKQR